MAYFVIFIQNYMYAYESCFAGKTWFHPHWSLKSSVPCTCMSDINAMCTLKNVTCYSKRAGDHPGTVDCTSKIHSSTLGFIVWGKGDCGPFGSPAVIVNATSSGASIEELRDSWKVNSKKMDVINITKWHFNFYSLLYFKFAKVCKL